MKMGWGLAKSCIYLEVYSSSVKIFVKWKRCTVSGPQFSWLGGNVLSSYIVKGKGEMTSQFVGDCNALDFPFIHPEMVATERQQFNA
jgi:hypothetical protein